MLHTLFIDFDKKKLVQQCTGNSYDETLLNWIKIVNFTWLGRPESYREYVLNDIREDKANPMSSLRSVCCHTFIMPDDAVGIIDLVITAGKDHVGDLFTFHFAFDGGTYISQHTSKDINAAKKYWAEKFDFSIIKMPESKKSAFIDTISKSQLSPMENLQSVWHMRPKIADKYGELHVIATAR